MKPAFLLPFLLAGTASAQSAFHPICAPHYRSPDVVALRGALAQARQKWASSHIETYTYRRQLLGQYRGAISGSQGSGTHSGQTMEQLFAEIERTINGAARPTSCVTVKAKYSAADGHILSYNWELAQPGLMDAFGGYKLTRFGAK